MLNKGRLKLSTASEEEATHELQRQKALFARAIQIHKEVNTYDQSQLSGIFFPFLYSESKRLDFFFNQRVNMVVWLLSQSRFCNKEDHWVKTCGRLLLQHCPVRSHSSGRGSSCRPSAVRMPLMRTNSQAQQPPPFQAAVRASRKFYTDQNVTDTERILPFLVPPSPSISPLNQQQHSWSQ